MYSTDWIIRVVRPWEANLDAYRDQKQCVSPLPSSHPMPLSLRHRRGVSIECYCCREYGGRHPYVRPPAWDYNVIVHLAFGFISCLHCHGISHRITASVLIDSQQAADDARYDNGTSQEDHHTNYPLSLPRNRTACPYFCNLVIKLSPCLTTSAYCLFLSSGRFVSMIPLTRSIVHGIRSAAMNLARSLHRSLD